MALTNLNITNSFYQLGNDFYSEVKPQALNNSKLVAYSPSAAALLGLDISSANTDDLLQLTSGAWIPEGGNPLAMVYSGHQFGVYVPRLGDGRAILLAEVNGPDGKWDLQLKGAGKTPYSRFGDGRAVLRSTIREYLCSEAMHGLGIPTTRALSIAGSNEPVQREAVESAAMLIRLARSHVRFGSFEYFHYTNQHQQIRELADHVIAHHYAELVDDENRYAEFFRRTVLATAEMIAHWQAVGFAHGVMNTDNMSILGDTLDYGPYGFLDTYDPHFICNHSDEAGRYAFNRQPGIALWNCNGLAHALSSLIDSDLLTSALEEYEPHFLETYFRLMQPKLGLVGRHEDDGELIDSLLALLAEQQIDYTLFFRRLCAFSTKRDNIEIRSLFTNSEAFDQWAQRYIDRLAGESLSQSQRQESMRRANPKYILRNYMAEFAIRKAEDQEDYTEIEKLRQLLASPFDEHLDMEHYAELPPEWSSGICVSCSS